MVSWTVARGHQTSQFYDSAPEALGICCRGHRFDGWMLTVLARRRRKWGRVCLQVECPDGRRRSWGRPRPRWRLRLRALCTYRRKASEPNECRRANRPPNNSRPKGVLCLGLSLAFYEDAPQPATAARPLKRLDVQLDRLRKGQCVAAKTRLEEVARRCWLPSLPEIKNLVHLLMRMHLGVRRGYRSERNPPLVASDSRSAPIGSVLSWLEV